jgi:sulfonate transport system ATP-binding protein
VCIVGPSGCGKSTLLHMVAGLIRPSEGEIWIDERRVENTGTDRILIFQELGLFPWLTVAQNVEFGMRHGKGMEKRERRARVAEHLKLVHLGQFADSYVHQLSGGMRQRVALARALATQPDVLLMDEPFAALDAQTREHMQAELLKIWAGTRKTVLFITHQINEAVYLADRVVVMSPRPGRIKGVLDVPFDRPRQLGVKRDQRFVELEDAIWQMIEEKSEPPGMVKTG